MDGDLADFARRHRFAIRIEDCHPVPRHRLADGSGAAVSPRKVRTMVVKADGTLVARETTEPAQASAAPTEMKPALATPAADAQKPADIASVIDSSSDDQSGATNQADPPLRTVRTTKVEAPSASTAPVPASRPADQPVNVVGTVTERGTVRKPAEEQPAAAEQQVASAAAPGGYVMQIASLPSESEAKKSYSSLSSKFGSLIGGRGYEIKKAEISGKGTFYRVRVPVGSKDAAAAKARAQMSWASLPASAFPSACHVASSQARRAPARSASGR